MVALTDALGKPRAAYAYDPWGNALLSIPDSVGTKNKFRFTGEVLDPATQLYYLRARYYDPSIGRFLSGDPFRGIPEAPMSLQRYMYALNNPADLVDPRGLSPAEVSQFGQRNLALVSCCVEPPSIQKNLFSQFLDFLTGGLSKIPEAWKELSAAWNEGADTPAKVDNIYNNPKNPPEVRTFIDNSTAFVVRGANKWTDLGTDAAKQAAIKQGVGAQIASGLKCAADYCLLLKHGPL